MPAQHGRSAGIAVGEEALERGVGREVRAAQLLREEELAPAEQLAQLLERAVEVGALAARQHLAAQLSVRSDQTEPHERPAPLALLRRGGVADPRPHPAQQVVEEGLADPRLEPALLARQ